MATDEYPNLSVPERVAARPRKTVIQAALLVVLIVVPFVPPSYVVSLTIETLILALFAMSLDVIAGYTGLVSFGHAAFYGVGAYGTALSLLYVTDSAWLALGLGILIAGVLAVPIGYLSIRSQGIYFAMLTLAFAQLIYIVVSNDVFGLTGGSNGLTALPQGNFGVPGLFSFTLTSIGFYFLIAAMFVTSYLILRRILQSPFGATLVAIRENEGRAEYAGYDVQRYKLKAFVLSALFGALAGALTTPFYQAVSPSILFWTTSGSVIAIVLIGGLGTLVGPIMGAVLYVTTRELVSPYLADWTIVLGIAFIVTIVLLPDGLYSLVGHVVTEDENR